jgi:predicted enzyme related to lactoylglutathione lyase
MSNAINWFEIAVTDLDRACRFYETTLAIVLKREADFDGSRMAIFTRPEGHVGGALVRDPKRTPGSGGQLVYLNANGKLDACLERVAGAGGAVVTPKLDIGPPGFIAVVRDSEGNLVGLHSER